MLMENPYRASRLNDNLTQRELANLIGITPQSVLMTEQGLFQRPPRAIRLYYPNQEQVYKQWISQQRQAHPLTYTSTTNWLEFRGPSFKGFCVRLYYQPSLLREFESRGSNINSLMRALSEAGVPLTVIRKVINAS